jgi:hypothetical protein
VALSRPVVKAAAATTAAATASLFDSSNRYAGTDMVIDPVTPECGETPARQSRPLRRKPRPSPTTPG